MKNVAKKSVKKRTKKLVPGVAIKTEHDAREQRLSTIIKSKEAVQLRLCVGIPMTGKLDAHWALARWGQVIPCNWSHIDIIQWINTYSPIGYSVADARNIITSIVVNQGIEWLLFIDHDTIIPPKTFVKLNKHMIEKKNPVVAGLYFTKSVPAEPLIYRGRGNGYYANWKFGDKVQVDGVPMGCTLIHRSILEVMYREADEYLCPTGEKIKRVFQSPAEQAYDPELKAWKSEAGTEDLHWCHRVITNRILDKAGWKKHQEMKYPFVVDTSMYCKHVDIISGDQFPARGEEMDYMTEKQKDDVIKTGIFTIE